MLPSREMFDQGYCVYGFRFIFPTLDTPAPTIAIRVRLVPSVLIFHSPFWLVSAVAPWLLTTSSNVVLLIARTLVMAIFGLLRMLCCEPPVAGSTTRLLGPCTLLPARGSEALHPLMTKADPLYLLSLSHHKAHCHRLTLTTSYNA